MLIILRRRNGTLGEEIPKLLTHNGVTQSVPQWAKSVGLTYGVLHDRLRRGWDTELALATPLRAPKDVLTYSSWYNMKTRCDNVKVACYSRYGGRGSGYDKRWVKYTNFVGDMGLRPSKLHSLERVDNESGYCKSNCRWVTRGEQNSNSTNVVLVELHGEKLTISAWLRALYAPRTVYYRRKGRGWSCQEALLGVKGV